MKSKTHRSRANQTAAEPVEAGPAFRDRFESGEFSPEDIIAIADQQGFHTDNKTVDELLTLLDNAAVDGASDVE